MQWEETTSLQAGLDGILYDLGRVIGFLITKGRREHADCMYRAAINFGRCHIPEAVEHMAKGTECFGNGLANEGEMIAGDFCWQIADNIREFFMLNPHQRN